METIATFETCVQERIKGLKIKGKLGNYIVPSHPMKIINTCGNNQGVYDNKIEIKYWYLERLPCQVQLEVKLKEEDTTKKKVKDYHMLLQI